LSGGGRCFRWAAEKRQSRNDDQHQAADLERGEYGLSGGACLDAAKIDECQY
jgi:hypothetical protein